MAEVIEIVRTGLHEQVAARLRTMLVEGVIPPGAKFNERALCAQLRVSRTPLREAIKLLAAEGLADLVPNRGAVAVKLGEADVRHAFELLAELEGLSGALAAQRISEAARAELRALHFEMLASFERQDLSAYYRHNAAIHSAINLAAANPMLTKSYREINARVQALRFRTNQDREQWRLAVRQHVQMIDALDAGDANGLRRILVEHLHLKRDSVLEHLRNGAPEPLRSGES